VGVLPCSGSEPAGGRLVRAGLLDTRGPRRPGGAVSASRPHRPGRPSFATWSWCRRR